MDEKTVHEKNGHVKKIHQLAVLFRKGSLKSSKYYMSLLLIPFREKGCKILFHAITLSTYIVLRQKVNCKF